MGKVRFYITNLVENLKSLTVSLFTERLFWNDSIKKQVNCVIDRNTRIGAPYHLTNISLGYGSAIGPNSRISHTTIGKFCSIGPNCLCGWGIHPTNGVSTNPAFYSTAKQNGFTFSQYDKILERKPITIGNDVFIGANVTILDGVNIGDGAVIGAGAVVSKDLPPYSISVGCPIKILKYRFEHSVIEKLLNVRWWDKDVKTLKLVETYFFDIDTFLLKAKEEGYLPE